VAEFARERGDAAHEGAANAEDMQLHRARSEAARPAVGISVRAARR